MKKFPQREGRKPIRSETDSLASALLPAFNCLAESSGVLSEGIENGKPKLHCQKTFFIRCKFSWLLSCTGKSANLWKLQNHTCLAPYLPFLYISLHMWILTPGFPWLSFAIFTNVFLSVVLEPITLYFWFRLMPLLELISKSSLTEWIFSWWSQWNYK